MADPIQPRDAARLLGVSVRQVYDLAAHCGPIPCYRVGRRVTFSESDILEYKQKCRCTEIKRAVASSLNSTAISPASGSALESFFRRRGREPRRRLRPAKKPPKPLRRRLGGRTS